MIGTLGVTMQSRPDTHSPLKALGSDRQEREREEERASERVQEERD